MPMPNSEQVNAPTLQQREQNYLHILFIIKRNDKFPMNADSDRNQWI